jgi:hypothetical protein
LYWVELAFNFFLILFNIQLMAKVDFVPLSPEEIERVEIEELKHRMEIKDHQREQRQAQAAKVIGQNDFVPKAAGGGGNASQAAGEPGLNRQRTAAPSRPLATAVGAAIVPAGIKRTTTNAVPETPAGGSVKAKN